MEETILMKRAHSIGFWARYNGSYKESIIVSSTLALTCLFDYCENGIASCLDTDIYRENVKLVS